MAYLSLLIKRRREIHARIGRAIEGIYADRLEEFHEMLAYHYSRSDDTEKAIGYLRLSGDKAARSYSNREAINYYREAIRLLDEQPESEENKKAKMDVYLSMIYSLYLLNYPEGSMEVLENAEGLSEELGDERALAKIYGILARYQTLRGNTSLGIEYCAKCFDAAEKAGDVDTMAETGFDICVPMHYVGRLEDVGIISDRIIRLIEEHRREDDIRVGGLMVYSHQCGWRGMILTWLGEFDEAESVLKRGLEHTLEVGDTFGTGWIEYFYSLLLSFKGDPDAVIEHARRSLQCFEETGLGFYMGFPLTCLGWGHYMLGEYGEAVEYAKKGVELNREVGAPIVTPQLESQLALFQLAAGDPGNALRNAEEALTLSRNYRSKMLEAFSLLYLGRVECEADPSHVDAALQHIRQGMSLYEEMGASGMKSLGDLFAGEVCEKAGRKEEALECLRRAEKICEETGRIYWLARTREALARLGQG